MATENNFKDKIYTKTTSLVLVMTQGTLVGVSAALLVTAVILAFTGELSLKFSFLLLGILILSGYTYQTIQRSK